MSVARFRPSLRLKRHAVRVVGSNVNRPRSSVPTVLGRVFVRRPAGGYHLRWFPQPARNETMTAENRTLRFDRREVALVFVLFVFVALLMFTVGIVVGKGLAQARYEKLLVALAQQAAIRPEEYGIARPGADEGRGATDPATAAEVGERIQASLAAPDKNVPKPSAPPAAVAAESAPEKFPPSAPTGRYTVQVGSYPTEEDARARVAALRAMGFPYAYFSTKTFPDVKDTWYRVWLGYFPDDVSAKKSGELLQKRGEVKNYLVRKADSAG
jgi:cell division septation protein DedD